VYVTNGGYGGVLLAIRHRLPMVVAGLHEGKNEINARVGYFGIGVNLNTESPAPGQLRKGILKVLSDDRFRNNVAGLSAEFSRYNPNELCAQYVDQLTGGSTVTSRQPALAEA
jgi:UDP:flavonoid glycosyltransferase YjiC (YdhE family)